MIRHIFISIFFIILLAFCKPADRRICGVSEFEDVIKVDSGWPVAVMLTAYRTTLVADGKDKTLLRLAVIDSTGREIQSASNKIRIYIDGDGRVTAAIPGEKLSTETDTSGIEYFNYQLKDGLAWLTFHAGDRPDKIKVEVRSESLWAGSHEIHTIPADVELMHPMADQIKPSGKVIERMIGADISFLPQFEDRGRKYYEKGVEKDPVKILSEHGFNYIRLRIFVNPENVKGYSPGRGFCGLDHTLQMAQRVKDAGLKLLLNIHYSDYWADPQQQNKPAEWASLDFGSLEDTVKNYTARVIRALESQGTPADMVQIGNEINHGLLWPDGHISKPDQLAGLLKAGVEGVRKVDESMPVMMHLALGGQNEEAVFWFDNMIARGVEFDVMGISYYPRWHGTLDDLKYNLADLVKRYKKPVNVVEYAIFRKEVHQIVFKLPDNLGQGTCIWEPIGYRGKLFDRDGNVIEGMRLFEELGATYLK
ncbi:MAG: glycosyl hydrolase 53 family protein [Bacteroidales bacterium]|nr:glycosyl hydrolase 53 family protein [Bacteroidales bacterium]